MISFNCKNNFYLFVLLFINPPAYGSTDYKLERFSLFYSPAEQKTIDDRRTQSCHVIDHNLVDSIIRLNGVAYINDQQWSVWINNHRIDPDHPYNGIKVIKVSHDGIMFRLLQDHESVTHHLRINQTLNLNMLRASDSDVNLSTD